LAAKKTAEHLEAERLGALKEEANQLAEFVAGALRGVRQDGHLKQGEMGHRLGVSRAVISNLDSARTHASFVQVIQYAVQSGTDPDEVVEVIMRRVRKYYANKRKPARTT
jgi:predicted transcriptional regulator